MEIKKRKLKLTYEGNVFELSYPTFGSLCDHQEVVASLDLTKDLKKLNEATKKFLVSRGLPEEIYNELESGDIEMIMKELSGKKN